LEEIISVADVKVNLRMVVLDILLEVEKGQPSHIVIGNALKKYQYLDKQDRSFISRLTLGTIERRITLDYIIDQFSTTKVSKQKPAIRNILRMGVYQLVYMDKVPVSAACNEAVKLAEKKGFRTLKGFVNGVLRNIARSIDTVSYPDRNADLTSYLSVTYSMPAWIVEMWRKDYGDDKAESMLKAKIRDKCTFIRCNTNKISTEQLVERLKSENVNARFAKDVLAGAGFKIPDYAVVIDGYDYLEALDTFNEGCFWVQDISSMLAAGDVIEMSSKCLDVCAAPGGKSLNAAAIAVNGTVESRDVSDYKVSLINENINRLGFSNITTKVWDAIVLDESSIEKYDVVIADLPCSGLGISGRKPDIRYNAAPEGVESLSALQREILKVVSQYVKPGGVLIYSTCTLTRAENDQNAVWIAENLPFDAISDATTILPGELGTDGFFIARFRRK
jgi:16S rRNA (cytosine967-C5)-methyltransferase